MFDINFFENYIHNEYFYKVIKKIDNELERSIFAYVRENSNINGRENVLGVREHRIGDSIGFQCRLGGDWEDPAEFILFVNSNGEVWIRIVHEGESPKEGEWDASSRPSEEEFIKQIEKMNESPVLRDSQCLGKIDTDDFKNEIGNYSTNGKV